MENLENKTNEVTEKKPDEKKDRMLKLLLVIAIIIIIILLLLKSCGGPCCTKDPQITLEPTQHVYIKPEVPKNKAKNITLPGWGSFTIPASKTHITKGFEFFNPSDNTWYADEFYYEGEFLEELIVDSGEKTGISHLLKLAGVQDKVTNIKSYDNTAFELTQDEDDYYIEAIKADMGESSIVVEAGGKEYTIDVKSKFDCFYMTFQLCLTDTGEVLYESGLVEPGMYIQDMKMTRALEEGKYDAYVFVQPYKSDCVTKCNNAKINIELYAK